MKTRIWHIASLSTIAALALPALTFAQTAGIPSPPNALEMGFLRGI